MLLDLIVVLVLVRRAPSTTKTTTDVTLPSTTQKLAFRLSEEVPLKSTDQIKSLLLRLFRFISVSSLTDTYSYEEGEESDLINLQCHYARHHYCYCQGHR